MDYIQLGKNIRCFRKKQNLTQEELAERVHISSSYMAMIENGTRNASLDILVSLANELHVPLDYLIAMEYSMVLKNISSIIYLYHHLENKTPEELKGLQLVLSILSMLYSLSERE